MATETHRGLSRKLLRAKVRLYGDKHLPRGWGVPPKRSRHKGVLGQSLRHKGSGTRRRRENVCGIMVLGRRRRGNLWAFRGAAGGGFRINVCGIRVLGRRRRQHLWGISGRGISDQSLRHRGFGAPYRYAGESLGHFGPRYNYRAKVCGIRVPAKRHSPCGQVRSTLY